MASGRCGIYGCGGKEVYRFPHTPTPLVCIWVFFQQHPYFLFIFKMFFILHYSIDFSIVKFYFYIHIKHFFFYIYSSFSSFSSSSSFSTSSSSSSYFFPLLPPPPPPTSPPLFPLLSSPPPLLPFPPPPPPPPPLLPIICSSFQLDRCNSSTCSIKCYSSTSTVCVFQ